MNDASAVGQWRPRQDGIRPVQLSGGIFILSKLTGPPEIAPVNSGWKDGEPSFLKLVRA